MSGVDDCAGVFSMSFDDGDAAGGRTASGSGSGSGMSKNDPFFSLIYGRDVRRANASSDTKRSLLPAGTAASGRSFQGAGCEQEHAAGGSPSQRRRAAPALSVQCFVFCWKGSRIILALL
jgi:hypothetical protein